MAEDDFDIYGEDDGFSASKPLEVSRLLSLFIDVFGFDAHIRSRSKTIPQRRALLRLSHPLTPPWWVRRDHGRKMTLTNHSAKMRRSLLLRFSRNPPAKASNSNNKITRWGFHGRKPPMVEVILPITRVRHMVVEITTPCILEIFNGSVCFCRLVFLCAPHSQLSSCTSTCFLPFFSFHSGQPMRIFDKWRSTLVLYSTIRILPSRSTRSTARVKGTFSSSVLCS